MRIKITGINGYLGTKLSEHLKSKGFKVSGINRQLLYGSTNKLAKEISSTEVIINLAGENILRRWTKTNRQNIYNSRIITTKNLVQAIQMLPPVTQPKVFISASAIGVYKSGHTHNETSQNFEDGFIGKLVQDWEKQLDDLPSSTRRVICRIGIVLGKEAKTIKNLMLPFKLGLGGTIASGNQAFPFIHETDLVHAIEWIIKNKESTSIYNLVAPDQINNREFTQTLAKLLKRPAFFPIPAILLKLFFGKAASVLLQDLSIIPEALYSQGYKFIYPTIYKTLEEIST